MSETDSNILSQNRQKIKSTMHKEFLRLNKQIKSYYGDKITSKTYEPSVKIGFNFIYIGKKLFLSVFLLVLAIFGLGYSRA